MCKINGKSFFSWFYNPIGTAFSSHNKQKSKQEVAQINAQKRAEEKKLKELSKPETNEVEGEMPVPAAPVTPVKTTGTGINNTQPRIGLNL